MNRIIRSYVWTITLILWFAGTVDAQQPTDVGLQPWIANELRDRSRQLVRQEVEKRITLRNDAKQSDTPAISSNSSSLVDRTSASDLVGLGLNVAGLTSNSREMDSTSMSATVSLYALK